MGNKKYIISENKLSALANSIAAKSGAPVPMTLDQMKDAVNGIELSETEYYMWQDSDGCVRITRDLPSVSSSGTTLKLPGSLMRVGVLEYMIKMDDEELQLSQSIVQEVEVINEEDQ